MNKENITEYDASTEEYIGFLPGEDGEDNSMDTSY